MSGLLINATSLHIPLADKSVHTIVTSPPYYGLRDYGTAKWEGGDPECDHLQTNDTRDPEYTKQTQNAGTSKIRYKSVCGKCGAVCIDAQIGLEVTPDDYIANLVEVFRECKRILRDDGTLWVNIGDSYASNSDRASMKLGAHPKGCTCSYCTLPNKGLKTTVPDGCKPKDLIGIPWMLAFALRADGWYLRQDIIWAKPNPMPESVEDRCTKSHEYIFLLSKSARYYYDNEAIKETATGGRERFGGAKYGDKGLDKSRNDTSRFDQTIVSNRNKRDVWTVSTKPYKGAHYATFNPDLIKPCILAGAPETCCAKCGAPYERVVKRDRKARNELPKDDPRYRPNTYHGSYENINGKGDAGYTFTQTTGYRSTCDCNAGTSSGIVFDPFVGSGTTVATAIQLGRKGIGIDLSLTYLYENAKDRIEAEMFPLLTLIEQE